MTETPLQESEAKQRAVEQFKSAFPTVMAIAPYASQLLDAHSQGYDAGYARGVQEFVERLRDDPTLTLGSVERIAESLKNGK